MKNKTKIGKYNKKIKKYNFLLNLILEIETK